MKRWLSSVCFACVALADPMMPVHADMAVSVTVQGDAVQPAGLPIPVTATLTNIGSESLSYPRWIPNLISVEAIGDDGKSAPVSLYNASPQGGNEPDSVIKSGAALAVPLAVSPLPPGEYSLYFGTFQLIHHEASPAKGGKSIAVVDWPEASACESLHITVRQDALLLAARDQDLVARARKGEPFVGSMIAHYNLLPVIEGLLPDLASTNSETVERAAAALFDVRPLPEDAEKYLRVALHNYLLRKPYDITPDISGYLPYLADHLKPEQALTFLADMARQSPTQRVQILFKLSDYSQAEATNTLRAYLSDPDPATRGVAAAVLAQRRDPAALPVLLAIAPERKVWVDNFDLYGALAYFPDDPRAESIIRTGINDPNLFARSQASHALDALLQSLLPPRSTNVRM